MEPIWLKEYPPGVPHDVPLDSNETLVSMFEKACRDFADRPAFTNFGTTIDYATLERRSRQFAVWLQSLPGVGPGDRVAIMMPNLLQYPVALFGTWRAGMVVVNVNPLYTAPELEHQLNDSGSKVLVIVGHRAGIFREIAARTGVRHVLATGVGDLLPAPQRWLIAFALRYLKRAHAGAAPDGAVGWSAVADRDPDAMRVAEVRPLDLACLQYTGGTTGRSKGAMLSHRNLVANVRQLNVWFASGRELGREIVITPLPLYHVYALTCNCLCYMDIGGHNILITDPRDTRGLIREMGRWKFTGITGVNTLYQSLAQHPDIGTVDFSALKVVSAGGMAVLEATARKWAEVTGKPIHEGFGLSETSPVVTTNPVTLTAYNGSVGLPMPGTDVSLRDDAGAEVPLGEAGELCVRGPQVMSGYWNDPASTAAVMTSDGFFRTGDVATVDARGYFRIVDRKKDMIDVSGLKVYPNEVESAIAHHPAVREAACIGVPDERTGEAVKLFIVTMPDQQLTADAVRDYLRGKLAPYKIPRQVEFRDALPKSNVGKILRRELRSGVA